MKVARPPGWKAPDVGQRTERQAQLTLTLHELAGAVGDMRALLDRLTPAVLGQETVQLDSNGQAARQYRVPFSALSVDYFGTGNLTVAAQALREGAPGPGPGVAKVGPGGFAVVNFRAYQWSLYGGNPGELVTVNAFGQPVPPNSGRSTMAAFGVASLNNYGTVTGPTAGQVITSVAAPAGLYDLSLYVGLGGTTGGDVNNMQLVNGSQTVQLTVNNTSGSAAASSPIQLRVRVPTGGGTLQIVAGPAAPTGTAVYRAQIVATQVGP